MTSQSMTTAIEDIQETPVRRLLTRPTKAQPEEVEPQTQEAHPEPEHQPEPEEQEKKKKVKAGFYTCLQPVYTCLDGITLNEVVDPEILDKLIRSKLLKDGFNNPFSSIHYNNEREQLLEYQKLVKNGEARVVYNLVKGMKYGRSNPDKALGLFNIRRELRHTLAKGYYCDIDIANCHPVILEQICKRNKIPCPFLTTLVSTREDQLKTVMDTYAVSRDCAKTLFLRLTYIGTFRGWLLKNHSDSVKKWVEDGKPESEHPPFVSKAPTQFIIALSKELKEIASYMLEHNYKLTTQVRKHKAQLSNNELLENEEGTILSYYLQDIERRILEVVFNLARAEGLIPGMRCVLCADGLMIPKDKFKPELLTKFSEVVQQNLDLKVDFTCKEMDQDYLSILDRNILTNDELLQATLGADYPLDWKPDTTLDFSMDTLQELFIADAKRFTPDLFKQYFEHLKCFKYFNAYHAHFPHENTVYKLYGAHTQPYVNFPRFNDALKLENGVKFANLYLESKSILRYAGFSFKPSGRQTPPQFSQTPGRYNLFRGFELESNDLSYDEAEIQPFLEHVKYLVGDKENLVDYTLKWFAHIIQKPHQKTKVAVVLYSDVEGVGKNIFTDILEALVSGYTCKIQTTSQLVDKFNADMKGKLLAVGDEIKARASEIASELKDIITREKENIEMKGKDKFVLDDYKNYIFTSNDENTFKVSASDRRYFMVECPSEKRERAYYVPLYALRDSKDKLKHLFNYFNSIDITDFDPSAIPQTEYKTNQVLQNVPSYFKLFLQDYFSLVKCEYSDGKLKPQASQIWTCEEFYKHSQEYARRNKLSTNFTERLISRQLSKLLDNTPYKVRPDNKACDGSVDRNAIRFQFFPFEECKRELVGRLESLILKKDYEGPCYTL